MSSYPWQADNLTLQPYGAAARFERFQDVWLAPLGAFKRLAITIEAYPDDNSLLHEAFGIVLLVSALGPLLLFASQGGSPAVLVLGLCLTPVFGLLSWGLIGLLMGMLGFAFSGKAPWKRLYVLTAYALLPWMFLAPATVLKISGASFGAAGFAGSLLSLVIWLWSSILFCLALQASFRLNPGQLVILLLLPLGFSLIWFAWLIGFSANLIRFLSM